MHALSLPGSPFENLMSEIISFLWWKETMSSTVSAFTTKKLPSFKPTAKAFPSGEKAQHLPPTKGSKKILVEHFAVEQSRWKHGRNVDVCVTCLCVTGPLALPRWEFKFHHLGISEIVLWVKAFLYIKAWWPEFEPENPWEESTNSQELSQVFMCMCVYVT